MGGCLYGMSSQLLLQGSRNPLPFLKLKGMLPSLFYKDNLRTVFQAMSRTVDLATAVQITLVVNSSEDASPL